MTASSFLTSIWALQCLASESFQLVSTDQLRSELSRKQPIGPGSAAFRLANDNRQTQNKDFVLLASLSDSTERKDASSKQESPAYEQVTVTKTVKTTKLPSKINENINDKNDTNQFQLLSNNKEFALSCRIHCTITLLRKHFSSLLELPSLSPSTAKWIYDSNITVVGPRGEQLAVGVDEVLGINRALAISSTAARRAGSLLDFAVGGSTGLSSSLVMCELIIDPNNQLKILVLWRTRLPNTEVSGRSVVHLSSQTGLVTNLQIEQVKINGAAVLESLGTALATIRSASRSALNSVTSGRGSGSSSTGIPLFDGIIGGIQDVVDAMEALPSSEKVEGSDLNSPVYVLPELHWKNQTSFVEDNDNTDENIADAAANLSNIDEYNPIQRTPIAGSKRFVEYALIFISLRNFAKYALYNLAGFSESGENVDTEMIREMFTTEAELVTYGRDGEEISLLRGGGKIADFYRTLSVLRDASEGDWKIIDIDVDMGKRKLTVKWLSEAPFKVEGQDAFIFEAPMLLSMPRRLPLNSDGDIDDVVSSCIECGSYFSFDEDNESFIPLKVDQIESLQLTVAGANADSEWAKSFVSAALRSGFVGTNIPDPIITELLRALTSKQSVKASPRKIATMSQSMPPLNESAAFSFYGIVRSLHNDLPSIIADKETKGPPQTPAGEFLADSIELRGLLGEVLIRGSEPYNRLFGVVASSLRAAMKTNRVRMAAKPRPTIEITQNGSIKMNISVALWIDAPSFPGQPKSSNGGFGVPLKIEITSLYKIDEAGQIREHQIIESRLNGMLTPGDVFSKWIRSQASSEQTKREGNDSLNFVSSFIDAIGWVRSQSRK